MSTYPPGSDGLGRRWPLMGETASETRSVRDDHRAPVYVSGVGGGVSVIKPGSDRSGQDFPKH